MKSSRLADALLWFPLLPALLILGALAPALYAISLIHQSRIALGVAVAFLWLVAFWILLVQLHNRRAARLSVTIPCTIAILAIASIY